MTKEEYEKGISIAAHALTGQDRADAQLAIDLAKHCVDEMQRTMMRVCDTAPPHLKFPIVVLASVHLAQLVRELNHKNISLLTEDDNGQVQAS